ncbi:MAG: EamA family transporter [Paracoccus sp. (in: a-proteobacteria)]|uniref:DMT family transporter n=1 Tax=Paracoccus sp. TaxID=267 RepID=UPI0026DF0851|nr:EamA family transporter [Paracoccus sp. (in: a-proteobacteria)]MDO5630806.1 EamA family transporter [Paracoccus sp. (in: a-proteobacteria)]
MNDYMIGVLAVLFASLVWGTTGTAATFAPEVGAAAIGAAAMGIGGLMQAGLAGRGIARALPELRANWLLLLIGGVSVAIYPLAFYGSMRLAGVTIGTVITIGSAPLLAALLERVLDGTRLTARWMAGAALGLIGMALLCIAESTGHASGGQGQVLPGVALGLIGGLTYAVYSWAARGLMLRGIRGRVAMGAVFGLGGLMLMPVLIATGAPFLASWGNAAVGAYMAVVPMFLGYVAFGIGLARIPASTATTISLSEPVIAAMLAIAIVGERLVPMGWAGVGLIVACLAVITLPARLWSRRVAVA